MDVPSFCADVQPFTLEGQVAERYSVKRKEKRHEGFFVFLFFF